jgi:hypothetical protein
MNNQLIKDSLKESNFSSNTHSVEIVSFDSKEVVQKEYPIPCRYYKNKLVLLPINSKKFYFYWEFTDALLKEYNLESATQISLKVIDSQARTIKDIECLGDIGEYFVNDLKYLSKIRVIAGFYKDGVFIEIIRSNEIGSFNTEINYKNIDKLVYLKREKGFTEIIRSSLEHFTFGISSASYIREIEKIQEFTKLSQDSLSSHTVGGK